MRREIQQMIEKLYKQYVKRKRWHKVVMALAAVVVFCTTYALVLPAITLETKCGIEEHIHVENCYEKVVSETTRTLACTYESLGVHVHTSECYDSESNLLCGMVDYVVHEHNEDCMDENGSVVCQLPVIEKHEHTDACYKIPEVIESTKVSHVHDESCYTTERGELTCQLEETEGYSHGESCYEQGELVCQLNEQEEHTHVPECYEKILICERQEEEAHQHTDDCYEQISVLNCGMEEVVQSEVTEPETVEPELICTEPVVPEHIHEDSCFVTETADDPLTCTQTENHTHGELCYGTWNLVCGKEEHTHTDECQAMEGLGETTVPVEKEVQNANLNKDIALMAVLPEEYVAGGEIAGSNLTWTVTKNDANEYTLIFDGEGDMPNYNDFEYCSWHAACKGPVRIVFGPHVTCIGQNALNKMNIISIEWGGVSEIREGAFKQAYGMTTLSIPGTVETIGENAFSEYNQSTGIEKLNLGEGIKSIGLNAFNIGCISSYSGITVHIPSTVENIPGSAFRIAKEITVDENHPYFTVENGILYNKDKTILVDYPGYKVMEVYEIPDSVEKINSYALSSYFLDKVFVPKSVSTLGMYAFRGSNIKEIYMDDGTAATSLANQVFIHSSLLESVRFPENASYELGGYAFILTTYPCLESLKIPNGVTKLGQLASSSYFPALNNIIYDAENAVISTTGSPFSNAKDYVLTVGASVNVLPSNFSTMVSPADSVVFEKNNSFEINNGALSGAGKPLDTLYGKVHVDDQGVMYSYNATTKTAQLVYCPPDVSTITVPSTITTEDGEICQVISVRKDSLIKANKLESIEFYGPEQITELENLAMANCSTLTSVNGMKTVEAVTAIFTGIQNGKFGNRVFYNTGLISASGEGNFADKMHGKQSLNVTKDGATPLIISLTSKGATMNWISSGEGTNSGGYQLLTGDTLTIAGSVGNTAGNVNNVYRIYFRINSEDANLNITPGKDYTFDGIQAKCRSTSDPYTCYLEFVPLVGKTSSITVTTVYPTPSSPGGELSIWGTILSEKEAPEKEGQIIEAQNNNIIQAYWTTKPDEFQLTKTAEKADTMLNIVSGDQYGGKPSESISWQIELSRGSGESSAYGKDYVKSAEYEDIIVFPAGINWHPDVVQAVKDKNTRYDGTALYAGNLKFAQLSCTGATLNNASLVWDTAKETIVIRWRCVNSGTNVEMNTNTIRLNILPETISVNMENIAERNVNIENKVTTTVHYHYAEDRILKASATKGIGGGQGQLKIKKTASPGWSTKVRFGEDVKYTIDVYNDGALPCEIQNGQYTVVDSMPTDIYIKPENMEKMFKERPGLVITISNAILAEWIEVTDAYGKKAFVNSGNTGQGVNHDETHKLEITCTSTNVNEPEYQVKLTNNGKVFSSKDLSEALKNAGYAVHFGDRYTCTWIQGQKGDINSFVYPGENSLFYVYGTVKDTFRRMNTVDFPNAWPESDSYAFNNANLKYNSNDILANAYNTIQREAILTKTVSKNGKPMEELSARHGEVLDYHLNFKHLGNGSYDNLPLVDDLYGSQYLLVPVIYNSKLNGCQEYTDSDGTEYYILREGATYSNVTVGVDDEDRPLIANSIEVTSATDDVQINLGNQKLTYSGVHTKIKWYFSHLDGGNYMKIISYKALVHMSPEDKTFTLGNVAWLNDDRGSRLYAPLWRDGTILDFEKQIVIEKGEKPEQDVLAEESYSQVGCGDTVTYRIMLHNTNDFPYKLYGNEIGDALPNNYSIFEWLKNENVKLTDVQVSDDSITYSKIDEWDISDSYIGMCGDGQQYITWSEETTIQFMKKSTLYLYFTLTYPNEKDIWDQYATTLNGNKVMNTFYLYTFDSSVKHDLRQTGRVLLQKGVYGMYHHTTGHGWKFFPSGTSRYYYSNKDHRERSVAYYVTLYNGGGKKLYLNDLHDYLPDGFTYGCMMNDSKMERSEDYIVTKGGVNTQAAFGDYSFVDITPPGVVYRSATINAYPDASENVVVFKFGAGKGEFSVSYDTERKQYYLNSGEAIVFTYTCDIGTTLETKLSAKNVIAMPYTDYLDTGVEMLDTGEVFVSAKTSHPFYDANDGKRYIKSKEQFIQEYEDDIFKENEKDCLVSDVTVQRGGIVPGVTKKTISYRDLDSNNTSDVKYEHSVPSGSQYLVNWEVKLHNSGTLTMINYKFRDIMPAPYIFQGDVILTKYDSTGEIIKDLCLFTILPRSEKDVQIITCNGYRYTIPLDGTPVGIDGIDGKFNNYQLSINKDDKGNEILEMNCDSPEMSIPEGGYLSLRLSSYNPTTDYVNSVYSNRAQLIPVQSFENVGQGSMIRNEEGRPYGAENSSPVTVSYGYSTSSVLQVTENSNNDNTAASTDTDDRIIVLENEKSIFKYTLTVNNDTEVSMTKLVLINNLPNVEDHSPFDESVDRGSDFGVNFASNPNFKIIVTPDDNTKEPFELDPKYITLYYSMDTSFGKPQGADWNGSDGEKTTANWEKIVWTQDKGWGNIPEGARSIRLIVQDDNNENVLSAKSKITFSFDAVANSDAKPGQVAWNSFGYHYSLGNGNPDLEAMPLTVGVAIPSVPEIKKKLVDLSGNPVAAKDDSEFGFLVYQGEPLTKSYESKKELLDALENEKRAYKEFQVSVTEGNSESGAYVLDLNEWQWKHGDKYNVVELVTSNHYIFHSFVGTTMSQHTFSYDGTENENIVCVNTLEEWAIKLNKTDLERNALSGAVFALYSPCEDDLINQDEVSQWNVQQTIENEGKIWYLKEVTETGSDGIISWSKLLEDQYYILEIKAPDGYNLPETGQILHKQDCIDGILERQVINEPGYVLPESGGIGVSGLTIGGAALMLTAAAGIIGNNGKTSKKQKKGGEQ